ncbi:hypothetical protein [Geminisphaera colitermitum]|uniref:hypothetical protein n=1 Tax=Geminisphaera colitermitum TaxID=1148786 RepID=UPI000158D4BF|nr:hypothetical protein [Geminisphaera colitermitum]
MRILTAFFALLLSALVFASVDTSAESDAGDALDAIFGPDAPEAALLAVPDDPPEWTPPAPLILPPPYQPALKPLSPPPLETLLAPALTSVMRAVDLQAEVLTSTGFVVLYPPVFHGSPLASLDRWLRIFRAAGIREIPTYASGTPAWVLWRQLSTSPLTTEADWIAFYRRLAA